MEAEEKQKYFCLSFLFFFFFLSIVDFTLDFCSLVSFLSREELVGREILELNKLLRNTVFQRKEL